ncbi:MAG: S-methyl-5'-thioadenosine phosphorylase [Hyphomicrobiales bacterium]|nr:S-methyl-5'-thioadenosine phosphorylase [Hyphomicrobiales bacterium]
MPKAIIGIIGGSGLYHLPGLGNARREVVTSPFGEPSDALHFGQLAGHDIVFLPRHGRGHRLSPSGINYRANIDVLKRVGVTDLISVSACGSFREHLPPGHFVLVDQFIDRTYRRETSFFGNGCVAHVSMAHPVAPRLVARIAAAAEALAMPVQRGGTYLCIEGPQFSGKAESLAFRAQGCDVIGMTAMPEAKLAREAEISYATIAMVTDYDCWHEDHDHVDVAAVIRVVEDNAARVAALLARVIADHPRTHEPCPVGSDRALDGAIMTAPDARDPLLLQRLDAILARLGGNFV